MPISTNESGVLSELDTITANENGVLYELDTVHSNENGVLYEIHSAIPKSLSWTPEDGWDVKVIYSGLQIELKPASGVEVLGAGSNSYVSSSAFRLAKSTHVNVAFEYSGINYSSTENANIWIRSATTNTNVKGGAAYGKSTQSFTFDFDIDPGNYYFRITVRHHYLTHLTAMITLTQN